MLRTGIITRRNHEEYPALKALGYDALDYNGLVSAPGQGLFALDDAAFAQELCRDRAAIEAAGLEIAQVHGVWPYDDTNPGQKELKFEAMVKSIRGTAILGSKYVVVHPVMPYGWAESPDHAADVRENLNYMKRLLPYAEQYGVCIALENMPDRRVPCGAIEELIACIDEVNSPHLAACLDVGHATALGYDAGDAVRMLGERLRVLHIHDNDGKGDLHWFPYYGVTNWAHFTAALKEIGFAGSISLETSIAKMMPSLPAGLKAQGDAWLQRMARQLAEEASR